MNTHYGCGEDQRVLGQLPRARICRAEGVGEIAVTGIPYETAAIQDITDRHYSIICFTDQLSESYEFFYVGEGFLVSSQGERSSDLVVSSCKSTEATKVLQVVSEEGELILTT
jgi:hypothetical protein